MHLYGEYSHLRFLQRTRVLQEEGILNIDAGLGTAGVAFEDVFEEKTLLRGLKPEEYTRVAARALAFGYMAPLFISNHWHEPLKHTGVRRIVRMILESLFEDVFATSQRHSALPITDDPVMKQQLEIFVARFIRNSIR